MFVNDVNEASYVRLMSSDNETTVSNVCTWRFKQTGQFFGGKIIYIPFNRHVQNC